jgi:hypothetical protein
MSTPTPVVVAIGLLLLALRPFDTGRAVAAPSNLLVIVGAEFPATDIPLATLKDAFRGRATSLRGRRLIPVNHAVGSPERVAFDRAVLGLEPAAVGRFWVDARIRDEGKPPTTAPTPALAVRIAAALPNAITYTSEKTLTSKVKVLTVNGTSATQPGYPLPF